MMKYFRGGLSNPYATTSQMIQDEFINTNLKFQANFGCLDVRSESKRAKVVCLRFKVLFHYSFM